MTAKLYFPVADIAVAAQCPLENVQANMPRLVEQLDLCGINTPAVQIGMIGTIAIESASTFAPVREAFFLGEPEPASSYRRKLVYYPYYGRGFIQITGEGNYSSAGGNISQLWNAGSNPTFDFIANPDNLLDPDISAAAAALYFRDARANPTTTWPRGYSLVDACEQEDDEWIRRLVYGGVDTAGATRIGNIRSALAHSQPSLVSYNKSQPPERQVQNWACSIRVTTWMLKSLGFNVDAGVIQDEMVPGAVTPSAGLLDHRGYGIAAELGQRLNTGTRIEVIESCTWEDLRLRAGRGPIALGSSDPRLYHWFNIAFPIDERTFSAPNPSPGTPASAPIGDDLTQAEFDRYAGTWSAVFVEVAAEVPNPGPKTPPDLGTLVGVAYHPDGVVLPALIEATKQTKVEDMRQQVQAVINFLNTTNPDK